MEALLPTTGPAKNLLEFARRADSGQPNSLGAKIQIATFDRSNSPRRNDFVRACEDAGLGSYPIRERFVFDPSVLTAIPKLVEALDPDIVQTHAVKSHFLIKLAGIHRKRPWIAFHHGYTRTTARTQIYNRLDRWSLPSAARVVTVCKPFADQLVRLGVRPERISIQHNSVREFAAPSNPAIQRLRQELGITANQQVILSVGRLSKEKGQTDLIAAARLLRDKNLHSDLRFVIAGEGPDRTMLERLVRANKLDSDFVFAGHVSDIASYYSLADLVVLPSHSEGSPNVLLEAMAAGRPIVATRVGGVPDLASNQGEAILVEKENPSALAEAMHRVLADPSLKTKLAETARIKAYSYSPQAYCDSMLALYAQILHIADCSL
jgi:glycosyltransferase involved in cell wall biosynthesis